jgi:hypothetical protein
MATNDGGPAFPIFPDYGNHADGMSLRDYFAAKALQGMLADPNSTAGHRQDFAEKAYQYADAMLAARGN